MKSALSVAAVLAQTLWLAYGSWLWLFGTGCETAVGVECDLEAVAFLFWGAVELIILPFAALATAHLLTRYRRRADATAR